MFGCEPLVNTMYVCDEWMDPTNGATAYNRAKIHYQPFDVCLFPLYECVLYAMIERVFTTNILCALYVTVTTVLCLHHGDVVRCKQNHDRLIQITLDAVHFGLLALVYAVHCISTGDRTVSSHLVSLLDDA